MGATTITNRKQGVQDRRKVVEADVTFSASYATGGDTVSLAALGLNGVKQMLIPSHDLITRKPVSAAVAQTGNSYQLGGTEVAPTIKVFTTTNTELAAATNASSATIRVRFLGY